MNIVGTEFGRTSEGEIVELYTLTNSKGMEARIITFGGAIISLKIPDRGGMAGEAVLGHDSLDPYLLPNHKGSPYFGSIVGRYGNRIGGARFAIDGVEYKLAANNGPNHLHGGISGFDQKIWQPEVLNTGRGVALKLVYTSRDGEEGYPGNLRTTVTYTLTDENELRLDYEAATDRPTVCNLTNHTYFNFTGAERDVLDHEVTILADRFTPVDSGLIPIGELRPVEGTALDFRQPKRVGQDIDSDDEQVRLGGGFDHNFVLNKQRPGELSLAATVYEPTTGRFMEVWTTEPGVQFYSGNFLNGSITGRDGKTYQRRYGLCLETQHWPNSPNQPEWPTTVLRPGEVYRTTTVFKFATRSGA